MESVFFSLTSLVSSLLFSSAHVRVCMRNALSDSNLKSFTIIIYDYYVWNIESENMRA